MGEANPNQKPLFGAALVYKGMGNHLRRLDRLNEAKKAFDKAYEYAPEDTKVLCGRAQVCVEKLDLKQAMDDINAARQLAPSDLNVLRSQATAKAYMQEFEQAAIINYRGLRKRKQPSYFSDSRNENIRVLENCIGKKTGNILVEYLPIIKKHAYLDENDPKVKAHVSRIPRAEKRLKLSQMELRKRKTLSRVLANKYLGLMSDDKFFLQDLKNDSRIKGANAKGSKEIKESIDAALESTAGWQDLLRSMYPYYVIKKNEMTESKHQTAYKQQLLENERRTNVLHAEKTMRKITYCLRSHQVKELITRAERMQKFFDTKTPYNFPEKNHFTDLLYMAVGEAYLSQHRLSFKMSEDDNRRRIAFLMGVNTNRPKSYDSVIANYPFKYCDTKRAIENAMARLDVCENAYMKCWLNYELSDLLARQKNYTLGKFYAKRCQTTAQQIDSATWWLNGCFALMSSDMQQKNTNEIKILVEDAVKWTKKTKNQEGLQWFLEECLAMSTQAVTSNEDEAIEQRQKDILHTLDDQTRVEAELLFRRKSTLPAGRRFSVLPRKEPPVTNAERQKYRQRHLSIVPGDDKGIPRPKSTGIPGLQVFDI